MAGNTERGSEQLIVGTNGDASGNDLIRVEASVTFDWVPEPGNSYSETNSDWGYTDTGTLVTISRPSTATGRMTFVDVSSSAPFQTAASALSFQSSGRSWSYSAAPDLWGSFLWDPQGSPGAVANSLLHGSTGDAWDDVIIRSISATEASFLAEHWPDYYRYVDLGHWVLTPDPHDVEVFGGAGNDTIYAGQGNQLLSGDDGNDILWAGLGADTVLGGAGNDTIHGGTGTQLLDGGTGRDAIYAGTGSQTVLGDEGDDVLRGGRGSQTILGGAGNDTISGGLGTQRLMGGHGNDSIQAGSGNQTLTGGAGQDVFAFRTGSNHPLEPGGVAPISHGFAGHVVIADFAPSQDRVEIASGINGLAVRTPHDLLAHLSSDRQGDAVLTLGAGTTVTFSRISASHLAAHVQNWFRIA